MKVYVLTWGRCVEAVTTSKEAAKRWEKFDRDSGYTEVELLETFEQYREWEKE